MTVVDRVVKKEEGCAQCSCPRGKHTVSVGGEATGCIIHVDCDEFKPALTVWEASVTAPRRHTSE